MENFSSCGRSSLNCKHSIERRKLWQLLNLAVEGYQTSWWAKFEHSAPQLLRKWHNSQDFWGADPSQRMLEGSTKDSHMIHEVFTGHPSMNSLKIHIGSTKNPQRIQKESKKDSRRIHERSTEDPTKDLRRINRDLRWIHEGSAKD